MLIERVFYPIETLGIGKRIALWTSGCSKRCPNCVSPEMWAPDPRKNIPVSQLVKAIRGIIAENQVDGLTISGGDPLEQAEEVLELIAQLHGLLPDILLYTGFTLQELQELLTAEQFRRLKANTGVLIDGRYIDALNDNRSPLIGSTNQVIHYFDESLRPEYEAWHRANKRRVQNIYWENRFLSVGIHNKEAR
jgi:anaerobic ribonucleoside-triphosphate reductase activating protein